MKKRSRRDVYEPINYVRMFNIVRTEFREPGGSPIIRIMKQLGGAGGIIFRELGVGVRNPECVGDWLGNKRRGLKTIGQISN